MKVHLGKYWRPTWFERRLSDGTYSALNVAMSSDSLRLQRALLPKPAAARRIPRTN